MPTFLTPYMIWIKIFAVLALLASVLGAGYKMGTIHQQNTDNAVISKKDQQLANLQHEYDLARASWETAKAKAASDAENALAKAVADNVQFQQEQQAKINAATSTYQSKIKALTNERDQALRYVRNPVASADPATDGLWVDIVSSTCSDNSDGSGSKGVAGNGGVGTGSQRCQLHPVTAERLVQRAAEANQVVELLNLCVDSVKVLQTPQDQPVKLGTPGIEHYDNGAVE